MKKELKRPKILLGLLVTLALALSLVMVVPVLAQPSFTGWVETDFPTGPGVLTFVDPGGKDVLLDTIIVPPFPPDPTRSSGWDIKDLRLVYDPVADILYVGLNSYETVGDADTDGNEGAKSYGVGADNLNLGLGETVSVFFDLDQDGYWDVIAGVPDGTDFSGFTVKSASGITSGAAVFGADLTTGYVHLGPRFWNVSAGPDLEFEIWNFSHLPDPGGELSEFTVGAHMGSSVDVDLEEDFLVGSASPAINIVKMTNGTDNNSPTGPVVDVGDTVTWTYIVTNPGSVNLTNIDVNDSESGVNPAYMSGDDGDNILQTTETWIYEATGTATAGQYANIGTATGYSAGFPVSDTDPDHYRSPFAIGGTAFPVNKVRLLAPWAVLLGCAGVLTLLMLRKRREA